MATNDEILFGRIAVLSKFVTQEQVDECIRIQEQLRADNADEVPHLGTIMVNKSYLSEREKRAILQVQKENLQRREAGTNARRQERIFGYLVMKLGYCTEQQVFECVREQAKLMRLNLIFRLGEVFVSKGYLTHDQVQEVLALQDKFIVTCPGCSTKFNVVRYQAGTRVKCPECGTIIQVPDVLGDAKREKELREQAAASASASTDAAAVAAAGSDAAKVEAKEAKAELAESSAVAAATTDAEDENSESLPDHEGHTVAHGDTTGIPAHEGEVAAPQDSGPADHSRHPEQIAADSDAAASTASTIESNGDAPEITAASDESTESTNAPSEPAPEPADAKSESTDKI